MDCFFDLSVTHEGYVCSIHPLQNGHLAHPQDINAPLRIAAQRKIKSIGNNTLTITTFLFSRLFLAPPSTRMHGEFLRVLFLQVRRETDPDRVALHCHWNTIATQQLGHIPFSPRGLLLEPEEQSRTRGCQSRSVLRDRRRPSRTGNPKKILNDDDAFYSFLQKQQIAYGMCVFYYCRTYYKAVRVGGGGEWRTCAMRDDEPRPVWMSLPITH